ncbi:MAG TPA: biotin attachment protein [Candidatus Rifleibacterium sp.]|nr:biotin attachment protein [Candidatus Rifleibacterium sp.]HPT47391.1 biotin attachment protein [Candidatus Rifleibacterium sp.]
MKKKLVKVMDTSFRDGFQSVYGARVLTADFMPAVEAAVNAGIRYFESGGGARFQSLFFYCNENAFDMMDTFRKTVGEDIELQTLARGVNVVGLDSQSSDVIRLHARLFKKHGVTTVRNFDALNDVENLIFSGRCIVEAGLRHQVVVTMMELPPGCEGAHTPEFYAGVLRKILDAGIPFDSVCFKDASGTSTPDKVFRTVQLARNMLPAKTFINFHTHDTAGTAVLAYRAALEAGADGIDLAMAPVSGGTSQPDFLTMWHALRGTNFDLGVDIKKILEAEKVFARCMQDYFLPPESRSVDPVIIFSPMPGGALTANTQMMRDNGTFDRYPEVISAMSEVVRKGGYGTSVTPVSQFYFQQAYNNVMQGPWKKIAEGYGKMVLGYFGKTPVAPDPELVRIASEQLQLAPTTASPLALNDANPGKSLEYFRKTLTENGLPTSDENLFIAATCQAKGIAFLKGEARANIRKKSHADADTKMPAGVATGANCSDSLSQNARAAKRDQANPRAYNVSLQNRAYEVVFDGRKAVVNGKTFEVDIAEITRELGARPIVSQSEVAGSECKVVSPLPGAIVRMACKEGDRVGMGDTIFIVEAMKMETEIKAPVAGTVSRILMNQGSQVNAGQSVVLIS